MGFAMGSPGGKDETRMKMSGAIYAKCIRTFNFISCVGPADYMYLRDKWLSERNCCSSSDFRVSFIPLNGRECFYQKYRELVKSFQLPSPQVSRYFSVSVTLSRDPLSLRFSFTQRE